MKNLKSILTLVIVACLGATLLSGCSKTKSSKDLMAAVSKNLTETKSISYDMEMEMGMSNPLDEESSINITSTFSMNIVNDPLQLEGNVAMDMGMLGTQNMKIYAEADGDQYNTYMSVDDGESWILQSLDKESFSQYNNSDSMKIYFDSLDNITESGTEIINGVETTKFDCVIKNENLLSVLEGSGMLSQFSQIGLTEDNMKQFYTELGDLPFTVWIDKEKQFPVRYQFEMGEAIQRMMDYLLKSTGETDESMSVNISNYKIIMTIKDVNNIDSIVRPDNLDNSQDILSDMGALED